MNKMKIVKLAVTVVGVATTFATKYFEDKEIDKKVAEAVAKAMKGES